MIAARCRRLPLTRTSVWSGARFRRPAGRTMVPPSLIGWVFTLNDGTVLRSWLARSESPCSLNSSAVTRSTGTADSITVRPSVRLPTTTSCSVTDSSSRTKVTVPVDWVIVCSPAARPGASATIDCGPSPKPQNSATPESSVVSSAMPITTVAAGTGAPEGSRTKTRRQSSCAMVGCPDRSVSTASPVRREPRPTGRPCVRLARCGFVEANHIFQRYSTLATAALLTVARPRFGVAGRCESPSRRSAAAARPFAAKARHCRWVAGAVDRKIVSRARNVEA